MINNIKTFLLMLGLTALLIFIGAIAAGRQGMIIAFIIAAVMNFIAYWNSDKLILKIYKAQPASKAQFPYLYQTVEELTASANMPMPQIYIIPQDIPNAFATGRSPSHAAVAVTRGILSTLNRQELRGVIGHELSHVKNRDTLIQTAAATLAGAIMMLATLARFSAIFGGRSSSRGRGGGVIGLLAVAIIAPIAAMLIQSGISKSREYLADRDGASLSGNPRDLASALEKLSSSNTGNRMRASETTSPIFIVNPLSGARGLSSLFGTHPPVEERIRRLLNS